MAQKFESGLIINKLVGDIYGLTVNNGDAFISGNTVTSNLEVTNNLQVSGTTTLTNLNVTNNVQFSFSGGSKDYILNSDSSGNASWGLAPADRSYYKHSGTTQLTGMGNENIWYLAGQVRSYNMNSFLTTGTIYAIPTVISRTTTISQLALVGAIASGSTLEIRLGIYDNTSTTNLYPNNLLYQTGIITGNTGPATLQIPTGSLTLSPNLYWFTICVNTNTNFNLQEYYPSTTTVLGRTTSMISGSNDFGELNVAQSYGSFPNQFPTTGATPDGKIYGIWYTE